MRIIFSHGFSPFFAFLFLGLHLTAAHGAASQLPPYVGRVTTTSAVVNVVPAPETGAYQVAYASASEARDAAWRHTPVATVEDPSPIVFLLKDLAPDTRYQYRLLGQPQGGETFEPIGAYTFHSQRTEAGTFSFALFSDAHITAGRDERMVWLSRISDAIAARQPEFVVMLGDNIQTFSSHGGPMEDATHGPFLYRRYRHGLGDLPASIPSYFVMGNWEGENGWHPQHMRRWARAARLQHIPNPLPDTYAQGGGQHGDFYAFSWGELLCVVLNVTGYTQRDHAIGSRIGKADDWTLGGEQKAWLLKTLKHAREPFKVIFIHHTVGGGSPDELNARYGRGGGLAAFVGEQAEIHEWMKQYHVQALFYGHDHVMTDIAVEGVHYICVGSAGAPWKFTTRETGYQTYWTDFGYTWVDLQKNKLAVSFVTSENTQLNQFVIPLMD